MQEDQLLTELYELHPKQWKIISGKLKKAGIVKEGKQCRERWLNYLSKDINHEEWEDEELDKLFQLHKTLGSKWVELTKYFNGRPENTLKNTFNFYYFGANRQLLTLFHSMKIKKKKFSIELLEKISSNLGTTINRLATFDETKLRDYISANYKRTDFYKTKPEYAQKQLKKEAKRKEAKQKRPKVYKRRGIELLPPNSMEYKELNIINQKEENQNQNKEEIKEQNYPNKKVLETRINIPQEIKKINCNCGDLNIYKESPEIRIDEKGANLIPKSKRKLVSINSASNKENNKESCLHRLL